jgi:hypothetical protein
MERLNSRLSSALLAFSPAIVYHQLVYFYTAAAIFSLIFHKVSAKLSML